jgi:hypothetical protein
MCGGASKISHFPKLLKPEPMMPFQKIPIILPGNTDDAGDKEVMARIQPDQIESFNDGYHFGCLIKFKSGEILMTNLTADQFEVQLMNYWRVFNDQIRKAQGGRNNIISIN